MEYRYLGRSGLRVSAISLGAWVNFDPRHTKQAEVEDQMFTSMKAAFDLGINFFDNAEEYGNGMAEVVMGSCLTRGAWRREDLVISTKIFWGQKNSAGVRNPNSLGLSRKHIIEGTDAALRRLQVDHVDLVFAHRADPHTPMEEIVRSFNHLIDHGKAFYWGTSEWSAEQIQRACKVAERLDLIAPIMEQPQYNMLHRTCVEREYQHLYEDINLGLTVWSPLAGGLLTGKYTSTDPSTFPSDSRFSQVANPQSKTLREQLLSNKGPNNLELQDFQQVIKRVDGLRPIASELQCSLSQLALAWVLKHPNVATAITGVSKPTQIAENVGALAVVPKLTPALMAKIDTVLQNKPQLHTDHRPN